MRVVRPNRQQRAQMRERAQQLKAEQKRLRELLPKPMKSTGVGAITLRSMSIKRSGHPASLRHRS